MVVVVKMAARVCVPDRGDVAVRGAAVFGDDRDCVSDGELSVGESGGEEPGEELADGIGRSV